MIEQTRELLEMTNYRHQMPLWKTPHGRCARQPAAPPEDPDSVEERRRAVGLEPLANILARAKPPAVAERSRF